MTKLLRICYLGFGLLIFSGNMLVYATYPPPLLQSAVNEFSETYEKCLHEDDSSSRKELCEKELCENVASLFRPNPNSDYNKKSILLAFWKTIRPYMQSFWDYSDYNDKENGTTLSDSDIHTPIFINFSYYTHVQILLCWNTGNTELFGDPQKGIGRVDISFSDGEASSSLDYRFGLLEAASSEQSWEQLLYSGNIKTGEGSSVTRSVDITFSLTDKVVELSDKKRFVAIGLRPKGCSGKDGKFSICVWNNDGMFAGRQASFVCEQEQGNDFKSREMTESEYSSFDISQAGYCRLNKGDLFKIWRDKQKLEKV
jgi:hypothetical protein